MLAAIDPFKKEIYKWTWKLKDNEQLLAGLMPTVDSIAKFSETDSTYILHGSDVTVTLNRSTGQLVSAKNTTSDNLSFAKGPVLVQGDATVTGSRHYTEDKTEVVEFTYSGSMKYVRWKMAGSGWA